MTELFIKLPGPCLLRRYMYCIVSSMSAVQEVAAEGMPQTKITQVKLDVLWSVYYSMLSPQRSHKARDREEKKLPSLYTTIVCSSFGPDMRRLGELYLGRRLAGLGLQVSSTAMSEETTAHAKLPVHTVRSPWLKSDRR